MTMLERAIAAAASAVGAEPEDLRWLATGARLREWQPGEWLFHESTPYDWTGIIEDGDVEIVRGLHGDEHLLYTLDTGSMVSEGTILGNTAHFASARTRTGARLWVITRETMDYVRQQNPQAYYRIVARIGQRLADRVRLLSDASFGAPASRPLLALRTERDLLGDREVSGRAYFGVQTLRAVENFAISGVALRDFPRFINAFAYVKKAAALANAELRTGTARHLAWCNGDRHRNSKPARLRVSGDQASRRVQRPAGATGIRPRRGDPRLQCVCRVLRRAQARRGRDLEDLQRPAAVVVRAAGGFQRDQSSSDAAGQLDHAGQGQSGHPRSCQPGLLPADRL